MVNFGQAAIGIIVLLVVVGGLLFIYYSRTNAVEDRVWFPDYASSGFSDDPGFLDHGEWQSGSR